MLSRGRSTSLKDLLCQARICTLMLSRLQHVPLFSTETLPLLRMLATHFSQAMLDLTVLAALRHAGEPGNPTAFLHGVVAWLNSRPQCSQMCAGAGSSSTGGTKRAQNALCRQACTACGDLPEQPGQPQWP